MSLRLSLSLSAYLSLSLSLSLSLHLSMCVCVCVSVCVSGRALSGSLRMSRYASHLSPSCLRNIVFSPASCLFSLSLSLSLSLSVKGGVPLFGGRRKRVPRAVRVPKGCQVRFHKHVRGTREEGDGPSSIQQAGERGEGAPSHRVQKLVYAQWCIL